jgi:hypothetical protein
MDAHQERPEKTPMQREQGTEMNAALSLPRIRQRRRTPWPIRIFVVAAILFGVWVDVSTSDSIEGSQPTVSPKQTRLIGLNDPNSFFENLVRTLASRR